MATITGTSVQQGTLALSGDGTMVTFGGFRKAVAAADPTNDSAVSTNRVIGVIGADGGVNTNLAITDGFSSTGGIQGIVASSPSTFYLAGNGGSVSGGIRVVTATPGLSPTTTTSSPVNMTGSSGNPNVRQVSILNGNLFASSAASNPGIGIHQVGTGLPTTGPQPYTPSISTASAVQSFFFADLDPLKNWNNTGFDTVYVTVPGTSLLKFSFDGTAWSAKGSVSLTNIANITGSVNGTTVKLYATVSTTASTSAIQVLTDTAGQSANINGTFAGLPTAVNVGANFALRGITFVPDGATVGAVTGLGGVTDYTLRTPATVIADSAMFSDPSNFKGGSLTVSYDSGMLGTDTLTVASGGLISVSGTTTLTIQYNGQVIGTTDAVQDGRTGHALKINFNTVGAGNPDVVAAAIQALMRQVTFAATSGGGDRILNFRVTQIDGNSSAATADSRQTINVIVPGNNAPVASNGTLTTSEDTSGGGTLAATDVNGDDLTYLVANPPTHGIVTITNAATGAYNYAPFANYNGPDSFTFKVNDGTVDSVPATVSITVTPVNDAPVASDGFLTTNEDTPKSGMLVVTDADGNALIYSASQPAHGSLSLNTATGAYTYTPNPDANGPDSFTFQASDGTVASNTGTINITVNAVNDLPVAANGSLTTDEDTAGVGTVSATDVEGSPLTYAAATQPTHGTLVFNTDGTFVYTPFANYNGPDSFAFKANDGTADSVPATVNITVNAVNDIPVAINASVTTNEDTVATGTVAATDADGNSPAFVVVGSPTHGALTLHADGSYSYSPASNYNGPDSFTFKANDGVADSNVAIVNITVSAINDAPVALNGSLTTDEDMPGQGTVSASDVEGETLTFVPVTQPIHGQLSLNANGAYAYVPDPNYNGPDSFTFRANDGAVNSSTATINITVVAINDAPVATGNAFGTGEDTLLGGSVTATDVDGNTLTFSLVATTTHGTLNLRSNGTFDYLPDANYNGPDSFTFKANDGTVDSNTVTVNLTVAAVNDSPVATAGNLTTDEDTPASGTVSATDAEGDPLTYFVVVQPAHGALLLNTDGSYSYSPNTNYNGLDSFTFKASDGTVNSGPATVVITVAPVNDSPVAGDSTVTTTEDVTKTGTLSATDSDPGDTLTFVPIETTTHGVLDLRADGTYSYVPAANYNGPDSFTYRVNDGTVDSAPASVSINVTAINDPPVNGLPATFAGLEDTVINLPGISVGDADAGENPVRVTLSVPPGTGVLMVIGDVEGGVSEAQIAGQDSLTLTLTAPISAINTTLAAMVAGSSGLRFKPAANFHGEVALTMTTDDLGHTGGPSAPATDAATITVAPVNDAPVSADGTLDVIEDTPAHGTVAAEDADGDSLSYFVVTPATHGSLVLFADGTFTYTPSANYHGPDSFDFKANDGTVDSAEGTINILVTEVNDPPTLADGTLTTDEDTTGQGTLLGADEEGDALAFVVVTTTAHGLLTINPDGTFDYAPDANYHGPDFFTFQANDGASDSRVATMSITVNAVNDLPVASDGTGTTAEDTAVSGALTATDADTGDSLAYSVVLMPTHGTLEWHADGAYVYTPESNFNGGDSFAFKVNDGSADSNTATVNITVNPVNDAPVALAGVLATDEDMTGQGTLSANDVESDPLTYALVGGPSHGLLLLNNDGSYVYTPDSNYNGFDSFTFKAGDGTNDSNVATVTITVNPVNDPPEAADVPLTTDEDTPLGGTLAVTETDGNSLVYSVTQPDHGLLTLDDASTGAFTYTPAADYNGTDAFTFQVSDGLSVSNIATVSIFITAVDDLPVANAGTLTTTESTAKSGLLSVTEVDGDPLVFSVVSPPAHGTVSVTNAATGAYTYTPATDYNGPDSFAFKVNDGISDTDIATVSITVTPVNNPPVAVNGALTTNEDTTATGTLAASDIDSPVLNFSVATQPAHGTVTITDIHTGAYSYSPVANFNGQDSFTFKVSDGVADSNIATVSITVTEVNDAPVIDTAPGVVIEIIPAKATILNGAPVRALTAGVSDADAGAAKGIAIVSAPATTVTGHWEYSLDGGARWLPLNAASSSRALLLADVPGNRVRFVPVAKFAGFASLSYKAWDASNGTASGSLAADLSGTAFSAQTEKATVAVGKTTPVIDPEGNPSFTDIPRDSANPAGDQVKNLLGLLAFDANVKNVLGLAVTAIDDAHGRWQWLSAGKWADITGVNDSAALLLGPATKVRFLPNPGFFGEATLGYHAWDQSTGKTGERAAITSGAGSGFSSAQDTAAVHVRTRPVLDISPERTTGSAALVGELLAGAVTDLLPGETAGLAVTATTGAGTWQYSLDGFATAAMPIKASTAAAVLLPEGTSLRFVPATGFAGLATLSYKAWNTATFPAPAGSKANASGIAFSAATKTLTLSAAGANRAPSVGIASVSLGTISEDPKTNNGVTVKSIVVLAKIADPDKGDKKGIALTAADNTRGTWQYSTDGKAWTNVGTVSATAALALADTMKLRFVPNANFFGTAAVGFTAWDGTRGSSGDKLDTTAVGVTAFGGAGVGTLTVKSVNDAPLLDASGDHYLPGITSGTSVVQAVGVLAAGVTDPADATDIPGIAVTAMAGPGHWQYSPDGTTAFQNITTLPLLLGSAARLQFVADAGKTGLAALTYQGWDGTFGAAITKPGVNGLSVAKETLTVAVGNAAPTLSGPGTLTTIIEDPKTNNGDTAGGLLGKTFSDTAVGSQGIAVTGTAVPVPLSGEWQYSLDGRTWKAITAVSDSTALLLPDSAKIRFAPAKDYHTTPGNEPTITYTAWDQTVGAAGEAVDTTSLGLNAFSAPQAARITITSVIDAPTLDTGRSQTLDGSAVVSGLLDGVVSQPEIAAPDADSFGIAVTGLTGQGVWQYSLDGFATAGVPILKASATSAVLLAPTASLRFVPADPSVAQMATLSYKAWDRVNGGSLAGTPSTISKDNALFFSAAIETLSVAVRNSTPSLVTL